MKKIIWSLLLFAMVFTSGAVCFAGSDTAVGTPSMRVVEQVNSESLNTSDKTCEKEKSDLSKDLKVTNGDDVHMEAKAAGKRKIQRKLRRLRECPNWR